MEGCTPRVEFCVLGPLGVVVDGQPVPLGSPKLRTVLAALLVDANSVVSSDRLIDILWGDDPPVSARTTLQKLVYRLRLLVEPDQGSDRLLVTRAPVMCCASGRRSTTRRASKTGCSPRAPRRTRGGASAAVATLDAALGLWRGPAFAEFAYDDFARAEATRLEELRITAVEDRVDAKLALGRHEELIGELERTVDTHPLRERSRAQLMLALYRAGRQVEALARVPGSPALPRRRGRHRAVGCPARARSSHGRPSTGARLRTISTPRRDTGVGCGGRIVPAAIGTGRARRRRGHARVRGPDHARDRDPDRPRPAGGRARRQRAGAPSSTRRPMRLRPRDDGAAAFAPCPYKGLACFESTDADYFFGRERLVAELVARVAVERFVGVVGVSGSGKSSLLLAGLCPALRVGALPGSEQWVTVLLTPGAEPLDRLARALAAVVPGLSLDVVRAAPAATNPTRSSTSRRDALATKPPGARLVVVVDQFEELFTMCRDDELRRRFVDGLARSAADPRAPVSVIVAVRADYYARLRGVARARPPARSDGARGNDDRARAPAGHRGAGPASRAPARARAHRRHRRRRGGRARRTAAALHRAARDLGATPRLDAHPRRLRRRRRGVGRTDPSRRERLPSGSAPTSRSRADGSCCGSPSPAKATTTSAAGLPPPSSSHPTIANAATVLATLTDRRLVTAGADGVEVAHEALLREWPRARAWLEDDREGRRLHHHLAASAAGWEAEGRDPAELYRGARLASALDWSDSHPGEANPLERDFLDTASDSAQCRAAHRPPQRSPAARAPRRDRGVAGGGDRRRERVARPAWSGPRPGPGRGLDPARGTGCDPRRRPAQPRAPPRRRGPPAGPVGHHRQRTRGGARQRAGRPRASDPGPRRRRVRQRQPEPTALRRRGP